MAGDLSTWGKDPKQALVGQQVATARGVGVGDTLESAGISVTVAAIVDGERMQDRASVWVDRSLLTARLPALAGNKPSLKSAPRWVKTARPSPSASTLPWAATPPRRPFPRPRRGGRILAEVLQAGGVVAFAAAIAGVLLLLNATMLSLRHSAKDLGVLRAIGHGPVALATVVGAEGDHRADRRLFGRSCRRVLYPVQRHRD